MLKESLCQNRKMWGDGGWVDNSCQLHGVRNAVWVQLT